MCYLGHFLSFLPLVKHAVAAPLPCSPVEYKGKTRVFIYHSSETELVTVCFVYTVPLNGVGTVFFKRIKDKETDWHRTETAL